MPRSIEETRRAKREHMARKRAADPEAARAYSRGYHHQNREKQTAKIHDGSRDLSIKRGSFYECRGGWTRHRPHEEYSMFGQPRETSDESTMIVLRPKAQVNIGDRVDFMGEEHIVTSVGDPQPILAQEWTGTKPGVSMGVSPEVPKPSAP